ncbi:maltooligosyl trehalose synthase [Luteitalea sp. TBR-22]|uniref:malto-oligosyltrehalose synthase n=1 Tax=Luteitalea sp. TBR-22 TaxID=2802971 RepID=UPI001AF3E625|nr:malto-oligosyltrehalose synthase [Luteitalea sp. TBR-22]BCS31357.1 maltooligosyl trehalose synthase [Luteitalea sp. TBR-22]
MSLRTPAWTPASTYRLQLGPDLTFRQVEAVVPYLAALGVDGLYLSPMLKARPGSTHGYDICDHAAVNPDLGTEEDLASLAATATAHGMGLVSDIVPNHMGVDPRANPWWREVLENGPCSPYAEYFDIDWEPVTPHLRQKVLLPILGEQYGVVLERGELRLEYDDGRLWLRYFEHRLPVNPRQTPLVLRHAGTALQAQLGDAHPAVIEFLSILEGLHNLPPYTDTHPERIAIRQREKEVHRARLVRLVAEAPVVAEAIEDAVQLVNGRPGDTASFDELHGLLEAQPYRLASWRTAVDEINYRRFFDVNELAGVCVEHEAVFEATHALVGRWLREGVVRGLRLDHPDGLFDPAAYFTRLQALARRETGVDAPLYVVAEKILSGDERLRADWEVHGTTGYESLNEINGLFVDPAGLRRLRRLHARLTGAREPLDEIVYEAKRLIMNTAMSSELGVLADALSRIARGDRHTRDFTLNSLRELITEYVACIPVYRTYASHRGWTREDEAIVDRTIAEAERRNPAMERSLFRFLRDVLLPGEPVLDDPSASAMRERRLAFAMKLQQYTGPVQAKGVEDTTFYRHNVLVSLNEVGADPGRPVPSVDDVHAAARERQRDWPLAMVTLSTHDTKLGEDVRARIHALSEWPEAWQEAVGRALRAAAPARTLRRNTWGPDRLDEYRFLQVLVGCWPPGVPVASPAPADLVERLKAYMLKAIREAKRHTSWIAQNEAYESATMAYVAEVLTGSVSGRVLGALRPIAERIARRGVSNSLAQVVLKSTLPGIPDTYQGAEDWKFDLVDPDNRRPVPFDALATRLAAIDAERTTGASGADAVRGWLEAWPDGRIKQHVVATLLRARRGQPELWHHGDYRPLTVDLSVDASAMAFARTHPTHGWVIVIVGLRTGRLPGEWPVGAAWATSRAILPLDGPEAAWRDLLTGATVAPAATADTRWLFLARVLESLPVAVLVPATG